MAEVQVELTSEEESRIKWESLLLGKTQAVVEPVPVEEQITEIEGTVEVPEEIEDSPEAVLSQLFKSMVKGVKE
jgi:hypothetical protein